MQKVYFREKSCGIISFRFKLWVCVTGLCKATCTVINKIILQFHVWPQVWSLLDLHSRGGHSIIYWNELLGDWQWFCFSLQTETALLMDKDGTNWGRHGQGSCTLNKLGLFVNLKGSAWVVYLWFILPPTF